MATYPKQLQQFDTRSWATTPGNTQIRDTSFGDKVVLNDGLTVIGGYTVNQVIRFLEEDYTGYTTTIDHTKREPRFQPFDTPFGDVEVFPAGNITGDQTAGELIEVMRVLWDIDRAVSDNSFGYATSVQT